MDHVRAMLDPIQHALPDSLAEVMQAAVLAWDQQALGAARTLLHEALELAQTLGYL